MSGTRTHPLDDYRTLGRSGLRVSPLCLGAMTFGTGSGWSCDEATATAILHAYLDAGGNFVDTADVYTGGESERILGRVLADASLRDRIVLATKFTFGGADGGINAFGNGRKAAWRAIDASLQRLGMDYVDLYWMHAWDTVTPVEEIAETFDALIRAGRIRYYGLSDVPAWFAARLYDYARHNGLATPIALQLEYSLLERVIEREHLPFAADAGLGLCPWSPLASGLLSGKYKRGEAPAEGRIAHLDAGQRRRLEIEATWKILDTLTQIASEVDAPPAAVALNWVLRRYRSTAVIIGATRVSQLNDNLAAVGLELSGDQLERLDQASRLDLPAPYSFFTAKRLSKMMGGAFRGFDPPAFG